MSTLTSPQPGGWAEKMQACGSLLLVLCVLFVYGYSTLVETKAAPIDESNASRMVYDAQPIIMMVGMVVAQNLLLGGVLVGTGSFRKGKIFWGMVYFLSALAAGIAGYGLMIGVFRGSKVESMPQSWSLEAMISIYAALFVTVISALGVWASQHREITDGCWSDAELRISKSIRSISAKSLLGYLPGAFLASIVFAVVFGGILSYWGLQRVNLDWNELLNAIPLGVSGVVLFCLLQCLVLLVCMVVITLLVRTKFFTGWVSPVIGMGVGLMVFGFLYISTIFSFGVETDALGLTHILMVTELAVGLLLGVAFSSNLLSLASRETGPENLRSLVRMMILSCILLPIMPLLILLHITKKPGWKEILIALAVMTGLVAAATLLLFPEMEDFFDRIQFFVVITVVLVAILAGNLVFKGSKSLWVIKLILLLVLLVSASGVVFIYDGYFEKSRSVVFCNDPMGKYSLRVVEDLQIIVKNCFAETSPEDWENANWIPPKFLAEPTERKPVMGTLAKKKPLVIFLIWDACRKDHVSLYGYERKQEPLLPTTPNLDKHADEFVRFTNAFSQATATSCSLRTCFTGRYSSRHMLKKKGIAPFWTNELAEAGYDTFFMNIIGADFNGISIDAFLRGLPKDQRNRLSKYQCNNCPGDVKPGCLHDKATENIVASQGDAIRFIECNRQGERDTVNDLLDMLEHRREDKAQGCFAFLHFDATHTPWRRKESVPNFGDDKLNKYDETIFFSDKVTGELIEGLKKLDMWDDTIFIVTADHGTGLKEHGRFGGYHPYKGLIHIPLIIKLPGVKGREIDTMVGLFDVGPTLIDLYNPEKLKDYEGRSLWPLLLDKNIDWPDRILFGLHSFQNCYFLIQSDGVHYIKHLRDRFDQLLDLRKAPLEKKVIIGKKDDDMQKYRNLMGWFLHGYGKGRGYNDPCHYGKKDE